jgi:hypothetical protein
MCVHLLLFKKVLWHVFFICLRITWSHDWINDFTCGVKYMAQTFLMRISAGGWAERCQGIAHSSSLHQVQCRCRNMSCRYKMYVQPIRRDVLSDSCLLKMDSDNVTPLKWWRQDFSFSYHSKFALICACCIVTTQNNFSVLHLLFSVGQYHLA